MPLIKDNELVPDPWATLEDDAALPEGAPAIVSLERWQNERETLIKRNAPLGIRLRGDQPPGPIAEDSLHKALAIWGPTFFLRPQSLIMIAMIIASVGFYFWRRNKRSTVEVDYDL